MTKKTDNYVGPIIERRLGELGKTRQWLADQVGVSPVSIHKWIHTGKISRESLGAVALVLEVSLDSLMGTAPAEPAPNEGGCKLSLQWLPPDEVELLEGYRQCTVDGKNMARALIRGAPKEPDLPFRERSVA